MGFNKNDLSNPLVSVVIPCYNTERFVWEAINSIINQTYENLEILICDDSSTDGTLEIIESISKYDGRVKIVRHCENKKIVKSLNELVSLAKGKYIARMDADDISHPRRIECQVKFMEEHIDCAVCGTNAQYIICNKKANKTNLPETYDENTYFLRFYCTLFHPSIIARAEILKQNPYDEQFIYTEDYELWCRLVYKKGYYIANLGEVLFYYRLHDGQSDKYSGGSQWRTAAESLKSNIGNIIPDIDVHNDIFFLRKKEWSPEAGKYIKNIIQTIKHMKIGAAIPVTEKIIYYYKIHNKYINMISLMISRLGFISVMYNGIQKIRMVGLKKNVT